MQIRLSILLATFLFCSAQSSRAEDAGERERDPKAAIDRGLGFLVKDALAWKEEHQCASCHHAALTIWSLREAKDRGHQVDEPVLAELTKWVAESGEGTTGVPRPADRPKAINVKAVWYALGLGANRTPDATVQQGLQAMLKTVKNDQIDDGSWQAWPETRPPMIGPSDDSMTALATLALLPATAGDSAAAAARDRGASWLEKNPTDDDPQSVAIRLILWSRLGRGPEMRDPLVERIRSRQNADGGWSQAADMASDAWATGQALLALTEASLKADDPTIARGREFLITSQHDDGSWPMTSRPIKPGGEGSTSLIPIVGAGSAWGVLGLVCSE